MSVCLSVYMPVCRYFITISLFDSKKSNRLFFEFGLFRFQSVNAIAQQPRLVREWVEVSERRVEHVYRTVKRFREYQPSSNSTVSISSSSSSGRHPLQEAFRLNFIDETAAPILPSLPAAARPSDEHKPWLRQAKIDLESTDGEVATSWIAYKSFQVPKV